MNNSPIKKSIFFVASPLQLIASEIICKKYDANREHIIVFYKNDYSSMMSSAIWKKKIIMLWPRYYPMKGFFGVGKRLLYNLELIKKTIGKCDSLYFHSAVYDTEAINYFVSFLPKIVGKENFSARVLPDGIISMRRYPQSPFKRFLKMFRSFRFLYNRQLIYTHFPGDRIGSDAKFIDYIYVFSFIPHNYQKNKVRELSRIFDYFTPKNEPGVCQKINALVIGQPLKGFKLMSCKDIKRTSDEIENFLHKVKPNKIFYKPHPRDKNNTLKKSHYEILDIDISIEEHLAKNFYNYVLGVNSTVLIVAKHLYGDSGCIKSFGIDRVKFKDNSEKNDIVKLFSSF